MKRHHPLVMHRAGELYQHEMAEAFLQRLEGSATGDTICVHERGGRTR